MEISLIILALLCFFAIIVFSLYTKYRFGLITTKWKVAALLAMDVTVPFLFGHSAGTVFLDSHISLWWRAITFFGILYLFLRYVRWSCDYREHDMFHERDG